MDADNRDEKDAPAEAGVHVNDARSESADAEQRGRPEAAAQAPADVAQTGETASDESSTRTCPSNTSSMGSQINLPGFPEYKAVFGIDWLEIAATVIWRNEAYDEVMRQLEAAKIRCQELEQAEERVRLNDRDDVFVRRIGIKRGKIGGEHFEYGLIYRSVPIYLARRPDGGLNGRANVFVQLGGSECLLYGAQESWERIQALLQRLGAEAIQNEKISRVDLRLDVAELNVRIFRPLLDERRFITHFRQLQGCENKVTGDWTGFTGGSRAVRIRAYDKKEEQRKKYDAEIFQTLIDRCWGGTEPVHASRIEYQLRRPWLKKYGIHSFADLREQLGSIAHKLTTGCFRFTVEPVESAAKHQSRAVTHPLWEAVCNAFVAGANGPVTKLAPIRHHLVQPFRLLKQGMGCFVSAALQKRIVVGTFGDFLQVVVEMIRELYPKDDLRIAFLKRYWQRLKDKPYDYPDAA